MIPAQRVIREKRGVVLPLLIGLALNIVLLLALVLPLSRSVAAEQARAEQAAADRQAAERALARAEALVEGKQRADTELAQFYEQILPPDFIGARRIAYLNLQQVARQAGLQLGGQETALPEDPFDEGVLRKYRTSLTLTGSYGAIRQFIHAVETQPNFLVIETVELASAAGQNEPLQVMVRIATYYRAADGL